METYRFLFDLAIILFSTKVLGLITRKMNMPQVVGALLAGLLLGPGMFGLITQTEYIMESAEVGVVILMFCAGMETDVQELKKSGKASFVIALCGVIVPLFGGFFVAAAFNRPGVFESDAACSLFLQNVFIGVILTATSVSITVETLKELGKLKTRSGNAILGAAVIDDILGIIALTIITSMADSSVNIGVVLIKIVGFFVFCGVAGYIFYRFFTGWCNRSEGGLQRHAIVAFVFALMMAFIAERVFGVADITGAYIAGIIISMTPKERYLASKFDVLSTLYLSPIFFASIGLKVELPKMSVALVEFAVILTLVAILTKVVGCGLGARIMGYTNLQSVRIGVGMISRGEVALIVASKGGTLGLMSSELMGPVVIVVIITTIIAPIILKPVFLKGPSTTPADANPIAENIESIQNYNEENRG